MPGIKILLYICEGELINENAVFVSCYCGDGDDSPDRMLLKRKFELERDEESNPVRRPDSFRQGIWTTQIELQDELYIHLLAHRPSGSFMVSW